MVGRSLDISISAQNRVIDRLVGIFTLKPGATLACKALPAVYSSRGETLEEQRIQETVWRTGPGIRNHICGRVINNRVAYRR